MTLNPRKRIVAIDVNATLLEHAGQQVIDWAQQSTGRYVCVSNVHMCMEAFDDPFYAAMVNGADLIVPDGRPLVWAQQLLGEHEPSQVRGYDLTIAVCREAEEQNLAVGFYGSTPEVIEFAAASLMADFPQLNISYTYSPPFRALTDAEDRAVVEAINASGVQILFVGLGCPKQEIWMAEHREQLQCVMLGVGAAFDFIAGNKRHAPHWMQRLGLEWVFRLASEPRRLWKRYLKHNPMFVWYLGRQLLSERVFSKG